ncbi:MAG TPA: ATPase [Desulfobacterales bacterium]|nr:ATPase [Desulfobacterales bacterium]
MSSGFFRSTAFYLLINRFAPFLRSPQFLLISGFSAVIWVGAVFLWLPWSHQPGKVSFLNALFTSTSAVCVTGLIVVDTSTVYTTFGQVVILLLIQTGGLGVMTFAALTFQMLGRRLSLQSQMVLHDSFFQQDIGSDFRHLFFRILMTTVAIEAVGMMVIGLALFVRTGNWGQSCYSALFHSISAFCNAGFSIYKDSLVDLRDNQIILAAIMLLIIAGGLGHAVLLEFWRRLQPVWHQGRDQTPSRFWSTHARVVWRMTCCLIVIGTLGILFFGLTKDEVGWVERVSGALFQSVTARTAGFNTVNCGALPLSSLMLIIMLMFIGGSPGSCAGGIKTTSFAIWLAEMRSKLRGSQEVKILDRQVPPEILWRNTILIRLAAAWNIFGIFLLLYTETGPGVGMHDVVFEQISAFGTVGLSTGLTEKLSVVGRLWIILTMFIGRVGPLTVAMWIIPERHVMIRYPRGRIMIG